MNHIRIYASTEMDIADTEYSVLASHIIYSRRGINVKSLTRVFSIILKLLNNQIIGPTNMGTAIYRQNNLVYTRLYAIANEIYYPEDCFIKNNLSSNNNISGLRLPEQNLCWQYRLHRDSAVQPSPLYYV